MLAKIPLYLGSYRNVDEVDLGTLGTILQDAYIDELKNIRRRPGLNSLIDTGSNAQCDGLYWWYNQSVAINISGGTIYKITAADGTNSDITGTGTPQTGNRVYFADFGTDLYAANGGRIIAIPSSGSAAYIVDADAPTTVSHVAVLNSKLIALDTSLPATFEWADSGTPTVWTNRTASPERIPDDLKALAVGNDRLWLWGSHSLELWFDDGVTPFAPEYNGHWKDGGIIGPDAFAYGINTFYWINQNRELVRLNGSQIEVLPAGQSQSLSLYIQGLTTVSDVSLEGLNIAGKHFIKMQFPTEDKTLIYDIENNSWYPWGEWNDPNYTKWKAQENAFCDAWNIHLVGDIATGLVYKIDPSYYVAGTGYLVDSSGALILDSSGAIITTDDTSEIIRTVIRTPHISHGSFTQKKFSSKYTLIMKRFATVDLSSVSATLKYRDNGSSTWKTERSASFTTVDDTTFRLSWRRNGSYYDRQLEIAVTDAAPLLITPELEEELTIEA